MTELKPTRPRRVRTTRASVRAAEFVAKTLISTGGICTIVAVSTICVFLVWVVVPLFAGTTVSKATAFERPASASRALRCGVDEYEHLTWVLFADGTLDVYRLDTGERLDHRALIDGAPAPTCSAYDLENRTLALGFANGEVRLGTIGFGGSFVGDEGQPDDVRALNSGELATHGKGLVERTPEGQLRVQELAVSFEEPFRVGRAESGSGIVLLDLSILPNGPVIAALTEDGELAIHGVRRSENLLTGEMTVSLSSGRLPYSASAHAEPPRFLELFGGGDNVLLAWRDGRATRYDTRDFDTTAEVEVVDLAPEPNAELTALAFLTGKRTLVAGDSLGRTCGWFRTKPPDATTADGATLVKAHELARGSSAVAAIAPSPASRTLAVAYAKGDTRLFYMTSEKELGVAPSLRNAPVSVLSVAPREGALVAFDDSGLQCWRMKSRHPEASLGVLFTPVWYEGHPKPAHEWQSSSGTDDFEAKLGLMPLVFGTLKATFYSMLFGVPLALLAAIYSSEFLHPRVRVAVKSTIEIMASLPSVVLGFLAGVVIAPFVQGVLPVVLTTFVALPVALLFGARVWQLLPHKLTLRWSGWQRFVIIGLMIPVGIALATLAAPMLERALFAGSIEEWLDGRRGGPIGGWVFLLIPLAAIATAFGFSRVVDPWLRRVSLSWTREKCARADLARFLALIVATVAIALGIAFALGATGFDPRGSIVDRYAQRNALIVGFIMGFAIIPIIYTLAEDALSSVPEQLRLASLGAGATPWQTAMRVIVPTAASGLFSAVMIGLGRAVGETMIVLMAAGNTPVMEWNIFSGFRTLSANVAVELPESVKNDTHYRTLFLAALTLFAMTFVVNTVAELVRQRFRKRAFQL